MKLSLFIKCAACVAAMVSVSSCHHKDLYEDHTVGLDVVFDWRKAPDASPRSMAFYLYPSGGGKELDYNFPNSTGGHIVVPFGSYHSLCMNNDNTDWVCLRNISDVDAFEVYTRDVKRLSAYGFDAYALPRSADASSERVAETPGMIWSTKGDDVELRLSDRQKTLVLYPEEAVCHYTVDIEDVENIEYIDGSGLDGLLSGMAEGYVTGKMCSTSTSVTMPFVLVVNTEDNQLHSEFLTFGECPEATSPHTLSVYMVLTDGSKWYYTFDVTRQVQDAPDPRHVHIVLKGLKLPKPINSGGGLIPDVDDWQTENVDIKM